MTNVPFSSKAAKNERWTTYLLLVVVSGAGKNVGMHCWKHSYKMSLKLEPRKEMQKIIQGCIYIAVC